MTSADPSFQICSADASFGPFIRGCRNDFDFTLQFEHILLSIVPSAVFIIASAFRIKWLTQNPRVISGKPLQWVKLGVIAGYLALQLALLILFARAETRFSNTTITAAILAILTAFMLLGLSWMEHARSLRPSILLTSYMFLTIFLDTTQARTLLSISSSWKLGRLFTAAVCLKGVIFLLEIYPKVRWALLEVTSPESSIGIFSIVTYAWLNPLILLGSKKVLDTSDLYHLDPEMASANLDAEFWVAWNNLDSRRRNTRLFAALTRVMKWRILMPVLPRLAKIGFDFCQPFLIQTIQVHLSKSETPELAREGQALIGATVLIYLGMAGSMGIYQYYNQRASTFLRAFLVAGIYRKTTVMVFPSDDSKASVTLMSTDVDRIQQGCRTIHEIWANTIEFTLAAWLLYNQLGVAFLVPIGVVITCFLGTIGIGKASPRLMEAWVTATQRRISATANLVANIESIKILGLTVQLSNLIQSMREVELEAGAIFRKLSVYSVFCAFAPMLLSPVLTFAATSLEVDTTRAFTSLAFLMLLTVPLSSLFQLLPNFLAAKACFDRIARYLEADIQPEYRTFGSTEPSTKTSDNRSRSGDAEHLELSDGMPNPTSAYPAAFIIRNGYFGWTNDQYTLHEINLAIPESKMTMVVGPVGSGKSTFCKALLGEIPFAKGHVLCTSKFSRIGFCDQTSFIPNASIRKVIVGCGQYDEEWYNKVIEVTALSPDIVTFPNGDQSMAGPNGSNLSGGQRQRIAIARALYARPTVFIFDDVFSGLDDSTENFVFEHVFSMNGLLRALGTTTIFCSHAVKHLPCADHIIALGVDGRIVEQGTYEQLKANQSYVHSLNIESVIQPSCQSDATTTTKACGPFTEPVATDFENDDRQKQLNDFTAHKRYLSTLGRIPLSCFAILSLLAAFCNNFSTIWLKFWSDYNTKYPQDKSRQGFYLGIYALIQSLSLFCLTIAIAITSIMMVKRSGRILHQQAIRALATAPLDLFNRTPPGVLLNRFSQDLNIVDTELEEHCFDFIFLTEVAVGMAIVIATASPYVMISYPVFGAILYRLQSFYLKTSKQLRFLDLETKSPLFLRAFAWTDSLITINHTLIDISQQPSYLLSLVQVWLAMALALMIAVLATFVVVLATELRADVGFAGASLVSLMSFGAIVTNVIKEWTLLELGMGAVSRLESFCKAVKSELGNDETEQLPEGWPRFGAIRLENVSASYGKDECPALRHISLTIEARERIAIVGRTGSGKSSIILLLLRLLNTLPSTDQVITIDGIPLQKIDHNILRSKIIALPQESFFLPEGNSYRANLDPCGTASATECEAVLEEVGLLTLIKQRGGLQEQLKAESFSQGQKQLFGVARAVLRARVRANETSSRSFKNEKEASRPGGILLLDEINSSADRETDALIQRVIRKEFEAYTIIAVTHREDSVQDFDRIVVMESGRIKEIRNLRDRVVISPQ